MKTNAVPRSRWAHWRCALALLAFASASLPAQDSQVNFTLRGRWPGYPRGSAQDVAVVDRYAYLSCAGHILILDISNPAQPVWLKNFDPGGTDKLQAVNDRIYVTRGDAGLAILEVAEPLNPVRLGVLETGYSQAHSSFGRIQVVGDYAYMLWWDSAYKHYGLDIVDIRNPAQPVRTASLEIPAQIWDFRISAGHAFVATGDGLWIVDVRDPLQPVVAGTYEANRWFLEIAAAANYIYVVMRDFGLVVLDVSDPLNPTPVGMYLAELAWPIEFAGEYAYLVTTQGLDVLDISDPTRVTRVGRYIGQLYAYDGFVRFRVEGDYGWFATGADGLQVIHLADPANPVKVGGFATGGDASQVRVVGHQAYLADGAVLQILDVSDPGHPVRLGGVEDLEQGSIEGMEVSEPYAYVAVDCLHNQCCANAFFVFDVSNPAALVRVGGILPAEPDWGWPVSQIRMLGDYAIINGSRNDQLAISEDLMFIDVSDRAQPVQIPGLRLGGYRQGISVAGQYVYVACANLGIPGYSDERLSIVDMSNPLNPVVTARVPQGDGGSVDVAGHYAYVGVFKDGTEDDHTLNGLEIFDISNPAMPVSVGGCEVDSIASNWPGCFPQFIQVHDQYAYLAVEPNQYPPLPPTLTVIDVKDPARPQPVGSYQFQGGSVYTSDRFLDIFHVAGSLIYVADRAWGLTILEVELPGTLKLKPPVLSGNTLTLSWNGGPGIKLQRTPSLANPSWQDVPNSEGVSQITVPGTDAAGFFRLIQP